MNIDPAQVEAKITPRTRAILPVHFAGRPCDMDALCEIATRHELESHRGLRPRHRDGIQRAESRHLRRLRLLQLLCHQKHRHRRRGMVLTRREEDAGRIKILALHGMSKDAWKRFSDEGYKHYQVVECGYKYNMMDLQAAIGIHQLPA